MRRLLLTLFRRLGEDERGAALLIFTLFLVPLLAVVAVGIDLSRVLLIKQKLTNAVDAAALAVGRHPGLSDTDATSMAGSFIRAHYSVTDFGSLVSFAVVPTASQVDVSATARVPTTFLKVLGYDTLDVSASSRVMRQQRKAEVVMVLDNSGSMAGSKMTALKSAAGKLVDILFGPDTVSDYVRIGLVPFTAAVNVGTDKLGSGWIDTRGLSILNNEDVDLLAGIPILSLLSNLTNVGWGGCVRARTGPGGYDLTDEPPNSAAGETLFVPYFAPDEPDIGGYSNNYLGDVLTLTELIRQRNIVKYIGAVLLSGGRGPNYNCVGAPIQPLTNNKTRITNAIGAMVAGGYTVIPEGLAWGWRALSIGPPFTEGAPYDDPLTSKILILLTDGHNNVNGGSNGQNSSAFSAYGYAASGHLGNPDGSETRQVLDQKTTTLCSNIKASRSVVTNKTISVYTIAFQVADQGTRTMLSNCASPPSECPGQKCYFDSTDTAALDAAFATIALGIKELRIAQ